MKLMRPVLAAALFCAAGAVWAAPASPESINELLRLSESEKMLESAHAQIDGIMKNNLQQILKGQSVTAEQQAIIDKFPARLAQIMKEEMSWAKMQPQIAAIYSEVLTQEEIDGLISFYQSPTGRAMVSKMPQIMQKSMALTQQMMMQALPRVQAAMQDVLKQARVQAPAPASATQPKDKGGKAR